MNEHVFLVGIVMDGTDREDAERQLHQLLRVAQAASDRVEGWWIAEDDRHDGSNTDSAVFVKLGNQEDAVRVLRDIGLAWKGSDE